MQDTNMTDEWIARVVKNNPFTQLDTGDVRTCPVRLSFPFIFTKAKPVEEGKEGAYSAALVIPTMADLTVLYKAAENAVLAQWPKAGQPGGPKVKAPFLKQDEMLQYGGFSPGGIYIRAVAYENRPPVYNQQLAPIVDPAKVYPGVWAVCTVRAFTYDKGVNKGVSFGLNSVMIVADDKPLGGSVSSPANDFAGVQIDAEVNPAGMFATGGASSEDAARSALFG